MEPAMSPESPGLIEEGIHLWALYDLRVIVILSLVLEVLSLILGPFRKTTTRGLFNGGMWFAFLFSSVVSGYGLALIRKSTNSSTAPNMYLLALWGPILFIHLGGPDTITAFSLEDNALWLRKYLNFIVLCYFIFVIIRLSPSGKHYQKVPAYLLCIVGIQRYTGWISSLLFSSIVGKEIELPKKPWLMTGDGGEDYHGELTNLQVLRHAYTLFTRFKGLVVGFSFPFESCSESRKLFLELTPKDAFRVVERELNFCYDILYTKAWVLRTTDNYIFRFLGIAILVVALVLFHKEDKENLKMPKDSKYSVDEVITYVLLIGSIIIDICSMLMVLTADWFLEYFRSQIETYSLPKPLKQVVVKLTCVTSWRYRWSNTLFQYNLIEREFKTCFLGLTMSLTTNPENRIFEMALKMIQDCCHVKNLRFDEAQGMRDFIIEQLKIKSSLADNPSIAREIQSAKGNWTLRHDESCSHLLHWISDLDFDECILTWHIATELCFYTDDDNTNINTEARTRGLSKHLSDYMLYLLIVKPTMMTTVEAKGEERSKEARDELKKFLRDRNLRMKKSNKSSVMNEACASILSDYYMDSVGTSSKSVLKGGCILAKNLKELGDRKWEVLSKVWFEMLCYTASHCQANAHMEELTRGGQIVTFVWVLMVHFGLVS